MSDSEFVFLYSTFPDRADKYGQSGAKPKLI
jgi:hypothetical protein